MHLPQLLHAVQQLSYELVVPVRILLYFVVVPQDFSGRSLVTLTFCTKLIRFLVLLALAPQIGISQQPLLVHSDDGEENEGPGSKKVASSVMEESSLELSFLRE